MDTHINSYEEQNSIIPTLEDSTFGVFFKQIVSKSTPNSIEVIRDWIDQQLLGRVGKTVRIKCVREWNESYNAAQRFRRKRETKIKCTNIDQSLFMDCILDSSFVQLEINIYFSSYESFSTLLFIIGQRCPKLREITITFQPDLGTRNISEFPSFIRHFKDHQRYLCCLTSLTIDGNNLIQLPHRDNIHNNYQSIFGIIGKFCPSLSKLSIYNICFWKRNILALIIVEEIADILFPNNKDGWSADAVLETLQIPSEFWNPLCFTLQELSFECTNSTRKVMEYDNCILHSLECAYLMKAFALRHLPKLQIFEMKKEKNSVLSSVMAVKILSDFQMSRTNNFAQLDEKEETSPWKWMRNKLFRIGKKSRPKIGTNFKEIFIINQLKFEEACRIASTRVDLKNRDLSLIRSPNYSSFTGLLSLRKLTGVDIGDAHFLRTIGSMCPHLKHVSFQNYSGCNISPDELESILNRWPKFNTLSLEGLSTDYVKPFILAFGASLTSLTLFCCPETNLAHLASNCTQLDHLKLFGTPIQSKLKFTGNWNSDTFLPRLEKLEVYQACLGAWSHLIERKSTLVHLKLNCIHIGTNAHNPRMEWSQVPEFWSMIESLTFHRCSGLTMTMVSELIPQLRRLRSIDLPEYVLSQDSALSDKIIQDFSNRNESVEIRETFNSQNCLFQPLI